MSMNALNKCDAKACQVEINGLIDMLCLDCEGYTVHEAWWMFFFFSKKKNTSIS